MSKLILPSRRSLILGAGAAFVASRTRAMPGRDLVLFSGGNVATAFSQLKQKAASGVAANVGVFGDSTSSSNNQAAYGFANYLATTFPANTTSNQFYNDAGNSWPGPTNIATGGVGPIAFWNASVFGVQATYLLAGKRPTSIDAMPSSMDLIIINYGLNSTSYIYAWSLRAQLMTFIEAVKLKWPTAPILIVNQNPTSNDNSMAPVNTQWKFVEALYPDCAILDVYDVFINAGKPAAWYDDTMHPSVPYNTPGKGQNVIYNLYVNAFNKSSSSKLITPSPAFLSKTATNLLTNGDFSAFSGAVPNSWTANGGVTVTKDTTIVDPLYGTYSVNLSGSVALQSLSQNLLAGGYNAVNAAGGATFAVRVYVPPGAPTSAGSIGSTELYYPDTSLEVGVVQTGGWMWLVAPYLPTTSPVYGYTAQLFNNLLAGATSVNFSRATMVAGPSPRNM